MRAAHPHMVVCSEECNTVSQDQAISSSSAHVRAYTYADHPCRQVGITAPAQRNKMLLRCVCTLKGLYAYWYRTKSTALYKRHSSGMSQRNRDTALMGRPFDCLPGQAHRHVLAGAH